MSGTGFFAGIENTIIPAGSTYFSPGQYRVRIDRVKIVASRKGDSLFTVETTVLESSNTAHPAGQRVSWQANFKHDSTPGNIARFVGACHGLTDREAIKKLVTEELCETIVSERNPLCGVELDLTVKLIETKSGREFSYHGWFPAKGE